MEINVNENSKTIEIWLTNTEKQQLRERLKPLYQEYYNKKFFVAVYESGEQALADTTSALLCYNRKRIAELEMEEEKQHGHAYAAP